MSEPSVPDPSVSDPSDRPPVAAAILERRSLRAFDDAPPPDEVLKAVFEAARWAPSSGNGQPWRFVLTRRGTAAHARLAAALRSGNAWAKAAPVLVLAAVKTVHDSPGKPVRANRRALLDLGLALQNLFLQGTLAGLVTHPMAGFDADVAGDAVGVEGVHEVAVLIALGYPGDPATLEPDVRAKDERPRTRQPQGTFVFEDRWGAPAAWTGERGDGRGDHDGRDRDDGGVGT